GIEITPNSFPSGHTTLAATAMIALVLAAGRARLVLAPLGAVWATAVGVGTLVAGWHRPSDVIGAMAVVAAWTFLPLALAGPGAAPTRHRGGRGAGLCPDGRCRAGGRDPAGPGRCGRPRLGRDRGGRTAAPAGPRRRHPAGARLRCHRRADRRCHRRMAGAD